MVSVVIPLSGAPAQALACLTSLAAVPDDPAYEVVVVDDASVGLEPLLARLEGDVKVVRLPRRGGLASAIAAGLDRATGDVVVLLRDAPEVDAGLLRELARVLLTPGVAAATAGAGDPVAAHVLACYRHDLTDLPAVGDELTYAALLTRLARRGEVVAVDPGLVRPPAPRNVAARGEHGRDPELTVVIPTLDATSARARACIAAIQERTDVPHELVIVDNGAPPQGFTAPVNAGIRAARGRYVVVCNDDVEVLPGWWPPLRAALDAGHPCVFPLTIDGAMREDFAAWCFALSRDAIEQHGVAPGEFLHPELKVWYQDTDLLQRLREAGTPPALVRDARIRHGLSLTVATDDPALRAWIDAQVARDRATFEALHGAGVPGAAH